ncbi:DNA helicase [Tanacetum coccineum]
MTRGRLFVIANARRVDALVRGRASRVTGVCGPAVFLPRSSLCPRKRSAVGCSFLKILRASLKCPVIAAYPCHPRQSGYLCKFAPECVSSNDVPPESLNGSGQCVPLNTCLDVAGQQTLAPDVGGSKRNHGLGNLNEDGQFLPLDRDVNIFGRQIPVEDVGSSKRRCFTYMLLHITGDGQRLRVPLGVSEIPSDMNVDAPDVQISLAAQQPATNNSLGVSDSVSHTFIPLSPPRGFTEATFQADNHTASSTLPSDYKSVGKCEQSCEYCGALFWTAREKLADTHIPNFKVRLYNVVGAREYELPTGDMLGAIVYEPGPETKIDYDIIIEERSGHPTGRLFQQYIVTAFCAIEQDRIDYIREHQDEIRNEYLSGIYDAINRGDNDGSDCGARLILPQSFTDRADIVDRVFEMKIQQFIKFLRDAQPFGKIVAVLYTLEFQKRGLPHCYTLVWVHEEAQIHRDEDIDVYISAELPSVDVDPECHRIVSELMMHDPCGLACPSAPYKDRLDTVVVNTHSKKTILTEWLHYNEWNTDARHLTYLDFPSEFVWNPNGKYWSRRQRHKSSIGRLTYVHPASGDLFYQRMLLCHQKGCRSFSKIRQVNNIVYPTCRAAYQALGLLEDDQEWENMIKEAACTATPTELRTLLHTYLPFVSHMRLSNGSLNETDREKVTAFAQWLLDIGDGLLGTPDEVDPENTSWVNIPDDYRIPDDENGFLNLIRFIYDDHTLQNPTPQQLQEKVIVCLKNEAVDIVNAKVMSMIPGRPHAYRSYDKALPHGHDGGEVELLYPKEYLNTLSFTGLAPHNLELKIAYNELADRANVRDAILTDYIRCIRAASGIYTFGDATSQRKQRRTIDIENLSGNIIVLTLWNKMAKNFDMRTYESLPKPVVIAVSSCWVSRYNGLQLSGTSATHYYLNSDIPETLYIKQQ